jgi:hypothetical protein
MPPAIGGIGLSNAGRFADVAISRPSQYVVSGVTRDATGAPLGGCTVKLFETISGLFRGYTISDANGNYAIEIAGDRGLSLFAEAYLAGSPDVAGTTINTLVAA